MNCGQRANGCTFSVHCDNLIQAYKGVSADLPVAQETVEEVYGFLKCIASKSV